MIKQGNLLQEYYQSYKNVNIEDQVLHLMKTSTTEEFEERDINIRGDCLKLRISQAWPKLESPHATYGSRVLSPSLEQLLISAQYAVSRKEDTAYQRLDFIRKCAFSLPNTAYPSSSIRLRFLVSDFQLRFIMDDPNITMEEYIKLEEEKAQRHGRTFNWQTATYGKMEYCEEEDDSLTNFETKYPAIVFDDTSNATLLCEPTIRPLNENKIDFRISFDESDDEDYMVIFNENSFSYKIIYVDNLKMDLENENDKVNMPSSPEPTISHYDDLDFFKDFENEFPAIAYNDNPTSKLDHLIEPSISFRHIDEFDLKNETSLSEFDEEEQKVLYFD
ncbi:hypothetical protein Tco_0830036 [Tanacetum coccineum]